MAITFFLKIDEIEGESNVAAHENEIIVHDLTWKVEQQSGTIGRTRSRSKTSVGALKLRKYLDAASPYLLLACMQGKVYSEMVLTSHIGGDGGHLDNLVITMEKVVVTKFDKLGVGQDEERNKIEEEISLTFRAVEYKYVEPSANQGPGIEHEVRFNT